MANGTATWLENSENGNIIIPRTMSSQVFDETTGVALSTDLTNMIKYDSSDTEIIEDTGGSIDWANIANKPTNLMYTDDIENVLTSTETDKALSANQGKVLNESKVNITDIIDNLTSTDTNKPLSANQGKTLKGLIDALPTFSLNGTTLTITTH